MDGDGACEVAAGSVVVFFGSGLLGLDMVHTALPLETSDGGCVDHVAFASCFIDWIG